MEDSEEGEEREEKEKRRANAFISEVNSLFFLFAQRKLQWAKPNSK